MKTPHADTFGLRFAVRERARITSSRTPVDRAPVELEPSPIPFGWLAPASVASRSHARPCSLAIGRCRGRGCITCPFPRMERPSRYCVNTPTMRCNVGRIGAPRRHARAEAGQAPEVLELGLTGAPLGMMLAFEMGRRRRYLFVCTNERPATAPQGSCGAKGGNQIFAKLKALLRDRGLAEIEMRACRSSCLDMCWGGPIIAVEPDDYFYGAVTEADLPEIVEALARGERVERLVVPSEASVGPESPAGSDCG